MIIEAKLEALGLVLPPAMQALGIPASFRGHEGRIEGMNKIFEVWGSELEPLYVLDLGDRLLNLGLWRITGRASGVPLDQDLAQLVTLRDGLVIRDQNFTSWDEGLRAAGLEPNELRACFRTFPPFTGPTTHHAMASRGLRPPDWRSRAR